MNLHEYQAKQLFARYGIPVSSGEVADSPKAARAAAANLGGSLWVVKAQVHAGGRGKAGGVKLAKSLPFVKEKRIGMLGFSRGAIITFRSIASGCNIKAACTVGAITDLTKTYNQSGWLKKKLTKYVVKGDPATAKDEYIKRSALSWPEKLDVPILLLQSRKSASISVQILFPSPRPSASHFRSSFLTNSPSITDPNTDRERPHRAIILL